MWLSSNNWQFTVLITHAVYITHISLEIPQHWRHSENGRLIGNLLYIAHLRLDMGAEGLLPSFTIAAGSHLWQ